MTSCRRSGTYTIAADAWVTILHPERTDIRLMRLSRELRRIKSERERNFGFNDGWWT